MARPNRRAQGRMDMRKLAPQLDTLCSPRDRHGRVDVDLAAKAHADIMAFVAEHHTEALTERQAREHFHKLGYQVRLPIIDTLIAHGAAGPRPGRFGRWPYPLDPRAWVARRGRLLPKRLPKEA